MNSHNFVCILHFCNYLLLNIFTLFCCSQKAVLMRRTTLISGKCEAVSQKPDFPMVLFLLSVTSQKLFAAEPEHILGQKRGHMKTLQCKIASYLITMRLSRCGKVKVIKLRVKGQSDWNSFWPNWSRFMPLWRYTSITACFKLVELSPRWPLLSNHLPPYALETCEYHKLMFV